MRALTYAAFGGPLTVTDLPAPVAQMVENFKKVFFEFDSAELSA